METSTEVRGDRVRYARGCVGGLNVEGRGAALEVRVPQVDIRDCRVGLGGTINQILGLWDKGFGEEYGDAADC